MVLSSFAREGSATSGALFAVKPPVDCRVRSPELDGQWRLHVDVEVRLVAVRRLLVG